MVDVDRVRTRYRDLHSLARDLRGMAATSLLAGDRPYLSKAAVRRADQAVRDLGTDGRTEESIEILHFLGWAQ